MFRPKVAFAAAIVTLFAPAVLAIPKVTRTGRYLYEEDGTRFYIKGIAYQEQGEVEASPDNEFLEPHTYVDPLADPAACARDARIMADASINTIRVYSVDSSLNHDACMKSFSDAGIYTIIDLALPLNGSIDRLAPSWTQALLGQYLNTIDAFEKYDNVLAYNVGNEVVLSDSTQIAPFVKAAARDVKAYLKSIGSDALVGYAAINGGPWRNSLADYLTCGSESTSIDLYGLNDYSFCGASGSYDGITASFADIDAVAYLSEYGCNTAGTRTWADATALLSNEASTVWSGGIAFAYFDVGSAAGRFGMTTLTGNTITPSAEFTALGAAYAAATPPNSPARTAVPALTYSACAAPTTTFLASNTLPGTPDQTACNCVATSLSCHFTPLTTDYSDVVGELLNSGCSMLGESGGSCLEIGGDGQTGVYGRLSGCDPRIKLSYVMSQYYEANNRAAQACSFAGNGTVNAAARASAAAVATSCIPSPSAVITPSLPTAIAASTSTGKSGSTTKGGSSSTATGGSKPVDSGASTVAATNALVGVAGVALAGVISAVWTLV